MLLAETADYFRLESNKLITDSSCAAYLDKANKRLHEEYERINSYLSPTTEQKLINTFLNEYIGEQHAEALLTMESSGLVSMIRHMIMMIYGRCGLFPNMHGDILCTVVCEAFVRLDTLWCHGHAGERSP